MISNKFGKHNRSPTVIAHRGLCSIFPQNTKQAIIAGIHSSDLTEFDVHLTKDEQIIVFHDRYLSRTTDIQQHTQFADKFKEEIIDDYQQIKSDWWVRDFTLNQLRKLKVFQPISYRPQYQFIDFKINTLQQILIEALQICRSEIHKNKLKSGLLIEIKQQIAASLTQRDIKLCSKIVQLLKKYNLHTEQGCEQNNIKIYIQSFNIPLLTYMQGIKNPLIQLYDKDELITEEMLLRIKTINVKGIGVTQKNLCDIEGKPQKRVGEICQKLGYSLFYWTIRDDDLNSIPFSCKTYHDVYNKLSQLGVTGFITQFPDKCKGVLQLQTIMYSKGNAETLDTKIKNNTQQQIRKLSECQSMDSFTQQKNEQNLMNLN